MSPATKVAVGGSRAVPRQFGRGTNNSTTEEEIMMTRGEALQAMASMRGLIEYLNPHSSAVDISTYSHLLQVEDAIFRALVELGDDVQ